MADINTKSLTATLAGCLALPAPVSSFQCCRDAALEWFEFGLSVIPISPGTKKTALKWDPWLNGLSRRKIIDFWTEHPDHGVGFIVGEEMFVLDADSPESTAALGDLEARNGMTPLLVVNTKHGVHHYYRLAAGTIAKSDSHSTQEHPERLDVKTGRSMVVLPPSPGKFVEICSVQSARELSLASQAFIDAVAAHNGRTPPRQCVAVASRPINPPIGGAMPVLIAALKYLDPDCGYRDWFTVGAIVSTETGGSEEGFDLFDDWSSRGKKYKGVRDTQATWSRIKPDHPNPVKIGTLKWLVEANGHSWEDVLAAIDPFEVIEADVEAVL